MDWWSLAPYWVPATIAVVAIVVVAAAARSRSARRSRSSRDTSSSDEWAYLDSSHVGEPHSERQRQRFASFRTRVSSGQKRHARR